MALSLTLPTVGGSENTWGTTVNTALTAIETYVNLMPTLAADNVFTGSMTVDGTTFVVDKTNNRVGIGTASPSVALDVVGAGAVSGNFTVDTTTFHVDASSNRVGIGTASPGSTLDVQGTGDTIGRVKANSSGAGNDDDAVLRLDAAETGEAVLEFYLDGADVGYSVDAFFSGSQLNYNVPSGATHDFQVDSTVEARVEGGKGIVADNTVKAWARVENGAISEDFGFSSITAIGSAYTLSFDASVFAPGNGNYGVIATSTEAATYVAACTSRAANGVDMTVTVWDVVNNTGVTSADFTVMVLNT